eukprot:1700733-Amphidinium_carterae.2
MDEDVHLASWVLSSQYVDALQALSKRTLLAVPRACHEFVDGQCHDEVYGTTSLGSLTLVSLSTSPTMASSSCPSTQALASFGASEETSVAHGNLCSSDASNVFDSVPGAVTIGDLSCLRALLLLGVCAHVWHEDFSHCTCAHLRPVAWLPPGPHLSLPSVSGCRRCRLGDLRGVHFALSSCIQCIVRSLQLQLGLLLNLTVLLTWLAALFPAAACYLWLLAVVLATLQAAFGACE